MFIPIIIIIFYLLFQIRGWLAFKLFSLWIKLLFVYMIDMIFYFYDILCSCLANIQHFIRRVWEVVMVELLKIKILTYNSRVAMRGRWKLKLNKWIDLIACFIIFCKWNVFRFYYYFIQLICKKWRLNKMEGL